MKIELNKEELNLLIECVTDSKNDILEILEQKCDDEYPIISDISHFSDLTKYLENIYILKSKLCNYSISNLEEN